MKYILIGSSDKLMLASFTIYLIKTLGEEYNSGEMHYLMSEEAKEVYVEDFCKKNLKGIFTFYIKVVN